MSSRSLGTLTLDLVARTAGFERGLDKAGRKSKSTMKQLEKDVNKAAKALAGLGVAVGVATTAMVVSSMKTSDALAKQARLLGFTTESLATYRLLAEQAGISSQTFDTAIQRMVRRTAEAAKGTGEAVNALKELGLSAEELARLTPDEAFNRIAKAMDGVASQGDRVRLAMKLFDSEGVKVLNMMSAAATNADKMREELVKANAVLDAVDSAMIEEANDAMSRAATLSKGFANTLAVTVSPIITAIAEQWSEASIESEGFADAVADTTIKVTALVGVMYDAFDSLSRIVNAVGKSMGGAAAAAAPILKEKGLLGTLFGGPAVGKQFLENLENAGLQDDLNEIFMKPLEGGELVDRVMQIMADARIRAEEAVRSRAESGDGLLVTDADVLHAEGQIDKIIAALNEQRDTLGMTSGELLRYRLESLGATDAQIEMALATQETIEKFEEQQKAAAESAKLVEQFWTQAARNMQNAMGDFFYNLGDGIDDVAKNFIDAMRRMLSQAMALATMRWMFGGTAFGDLIGVSGANAGGGAAMPGQLRQVNEHGPELLSVGGKDYLMMGSQQGQVTPTGKLGGTTIVNNIDARGAVSIVEMRRVAEEAARKGTADALYAMQRGMLPG